MRDFLITLLFFTDLIVVVYLFTYDFLHILFTIISFLDVRYWLTRKRVENIQELLSSPFLPSITLLVPAYNEEVTIVESIRSLLRLDYPDYEIAIVNDGSKDKTVEVLIKAFDFKPADIDYYEILPTMPVRGLYRAPVPEGSNAKRLVLIDKENGGKADALNAAINAARGQYVCSMDADSLLVPDALLLLVLPILEDVNRTFAVGGQVVPSNGCQVQNGRLVRVGIPKSWIARFQLVEYIRSFVQGRTALNRFNSILILSGVCAVFQRELILKIGGFLTRHQTNLIGIEYTGPEKETVCEDMEIVVRLHRYLLDKGIPGRVVFFPLPIAWTEVPEVLQSLGKQRSRWYRGLWETLYFHREVMFNPRYKQIGLFSMPYQLFFEALGPLIEGLGYVILPLSWLVGILDTKFFLLFLAVAFFFSTMISTLSVLMGLWSEGHYSRVTSFADALLPFTPKEVALLILYGIIANFGYRQYIVWYQIKGFKDFLAGKKSWDKFARKGFQQTSS